MVCAPCQNYLDMRLRKNVEGLLPAAIEAVGKHLGKDLNDPKKLKGYIRAMSGFATSVRQMGVVPTIAVLSDQGDSEIKRSLIWTLLVTVAKSNISPVEHIDALIVNGKEDEKIVSKAGLNQIKTNSSRQRELAKELIQASIALKLALRTLEPQNPEDVGGQNQPDTSKPKENE